MKGLRKADANILSLLKEHPEGLSLTSIHKLLQFQTTIQNTSVRLRKLEQKGYTIKRDKLHFITQLGIEALKHFQEGFNDAALGGRKDLNPPEPLNPQNPPSVPPPSVPPATMPPANPPASPATSPPTSPLTPKEPSQMPPQARQPPEPSQTSLRQGAPAQAMLQYPHQRMHAIKLTMRLYRTSYDRWEHIASALGLPYKVVRNVRPKQYILSWQGIKLKLTRHKLISYPHEILAPLEVKETDLEDKALRDNMQSIESFLDKTGLRCQRALDGSLVANIRGWEIAFTDNELARRLTKKGGFISIAFNRITGKTTLWADDSFTTELEAGEGAIHEKMRAWGQAIQDGLIAPYQDELATRQQFSQIAGILREQAGFFVKHNRMIDKMTELIDDLMKERRQRKL